MPRVAVFDCDGTLVDGQADVCQAMGGAFAAVGLAAPDMNRVRRIVGLSLPVAIRRLVPDADEATAGELVRCYKEAFFARRSAGLLHEPLFDGIAELLETLKADGWLLAVATGKSDRGLGACLAAHGLSDLFTSLQTADRHPSKPHPAMLKAALFECGAQPGDAVMIGDTTFDMEMARVAGVRAVGVAWGYHAPEELQDYGAEQVAMTAAHLQEIIDGQSPPR